MARTANQGDAWLHGRTVDLLVGAGAGYLITVPLLAYAARDGLQAWAPETVLVLSLLFNTPHYGATLIRVLGTPRARARYGAIMRWTTAVLALLFVAGTQLPLVGSAIITAYLLWSPWHFAGQNYGLALTFMRRQGVAVDATTRRMLYVAFWLSFGVALAVFQTEGQSSTFAADITATSAGLGALRAGLPATWTIPIVLALSVAYVVLTLVSIVRLGSAGAPRSGLFAVASLVACQACWFVVPAIGLATGYPLTSLAFTAFWASVAHSAQYLWVTSYYTRREEAGFGWGAWTLRVLLAGSFAVVLPGLAAAHLLSGAPSWIGGLGVLGASVVNLHHFVIDGAIWKLRDGQVAKILLGNDTSADVDAEPSRALRWSARGLWAAAVLCTLALVVEIWDLRADESGDLARLKSAVWRLELIGRDRVDMVEKLGRAYIDAGQRDAGLDVMRGALEIERSPTLLNNIAWKLATDPKSNREEHLEAVAYAEEAVDREGRRQPDSLDTLAAAYARVGRFRDAVATCDAALATIRATNLPGVPGLEQRLALYRAGRPYLSHN